MARLAGIKKKARFGEAGLGKGGNLGMGSIYLFFLAFFLTAIKLFSSCAEDGLGATVNPLWLSASVALYVVASGCVVKQNL